MVAPLAMPRDVAGKSSTEINKALARYDVKETFTAQRLAPSGNTPEQYAAFIKSEAAKWGRLIKDAGITIR